MNLLPVRIDCSIVSAMGTHTNINAYPCRTTRRHRPRRSASGRLCHCAILSRTPSKTRASGFRSRPVPETLLGCSQYTSLQRLTTPNSLESASGVPYYGYRFYAPELGRWINRDPIGEIVISDTEFRRQQSLKLNYKAQMADSAGFSTVASVIRTAGITHNYAEETHNFHALYDINLYMITNNDVIALWDVLGLFCYTERHLVYDFTRRRRFRDTDILSEYRLVDWQDGGWNRLFGRQWTCFWERDVTRRQGVRERRFYMYINLRICVDRCPPPSISAWTERGSTVTERALLGLWGDFRLAGT